MKIKVKRVLLLTVAFIALAFGFKTNQTKKNAAALESVKTQTSLRKPQTDPDKTQLLGEWSKTGTPYLIRITGLLDTGKMEVSYYDPMKIEIEKASWSKLGTLLSVYIELQSPVYPGSSFRLNYIPERDVLVGTYYDAPQDMEYAEEYVRIK